MTSGVTAEIVDRNKLEAGTNPYDEPLFRITVQSTHGNEPELEYHCSDVNRSLPMSGDNIFTYSGCQTDSGHSRMNLRLPFVLEKSLIEQGSCDPRFDSSCKLLVYNVTLLLSRMVKPLFQAQSLLLDWRQYGSNVRSLSSAITLLFPIRVSIVLDDESVINMEKILSFSLPNQLLELSDNSSVTPDHLKLDYPRRSTYMFPRKEHLSLFIQAHRQWEWEASTQSPMSICPPPSGMNDRSYAASIQQNFGIDAQAAAAGIHEGLLNLIIYHVNDTIPIKFLNVNISVNVRESFASLIGENEVELWYPQSSSKSFEHAIELRNDGDLKMKYFSDVVKGNGTTRMTSSNGSVLPMESSKIPFIVRPEFAGIWDSWILIRTDAWRGEQRDLKPSDFNLSSIDDGVFFWYHVRLIVTTIVSCAGSDEQLELRPLEATTNTWTVITAVGPVSLSIYLLLLWLVSW